MYKQAIENNWLNTELAKLIDRDLVNDKGVQLATMQLSRHAVQWKRSIDGVEVFYKRFYFRAPKIASIVGEMVRSPQMMKRRLREGVEFFQFIKDRHKAA